MKLSKRIITCIGLVIIMLSSGIYVMAHEISESGKIEVIFDENSIFTEEEKQIIESSFFENSDGNTTEPYGVMCTLFGHDYKSETTTVIRHKVYASAPRCVKEWYDTKICTRCSDTQSTILSSKNIDCCK